MRLLLLGGTGAIGNHLVDLLTIDRENVVVTSRSRSGIEGNTRYVRGDAQNHEFLKKLMAEEWDAIVDFMAYPTPAFADRIDLLLSSTSQYVFFSSSRVFADSKSPITEDSPRLLEVSADKDYLSTDEYALAKARQEDILRNSKRENWTIIRPYITYSQQRLQLGTLEKEHWLFRALHGRSIVFPRELKPKLTTLTYGWDVARAAKAIIGDRLALRESINVTGGESITWNSVLEVYLDVLEKHLGTRPKVLFQDLGSFYQPSKYQMVYDRLYDRVFDTQKLARYVDITTFSSARDGLRSCLERFLENPAFRGINWGSEACKDRASKEHTLIREIPGIKHKVKYLVWRNSMIKS